MNIPDRLYIETTNLCNARCVFCMYPKIHGTFPIEYMEKSLFENVVQPVRDNFGVTVINSGYRGPKLNEAVGGSSKSQHCIGEAVDIECPGTSNYAVASWIEQNLDFDQLILEFYTPGIPDSGWVHVSYKSEGNRKSILTAMKENGKTVYKPGLIE